MMRVIAFHKNIHLWISWTSAIEPTGKCYEANILLLSLSRKGLSLLIRKIKSSSYIVY